MKTLKKLPVLLAIFCTMFAFSCTEEELNPRGDGDGEEPPIVIPPPKAQSFAAPAETIKFLG